MAIFPIRERIFTGAAFVSPPWVLRKCTCRNAAAKSRETAIGALTNPGAVAVAKPRGAYAPALALLCECPPAKNDFCAAQTQVQPRAATVSPPWFGHPGVVRPESRNVRRLAHAESRAAGVSPPWFDNTIGPAADFFGLNTFLHRTFDSPHHGGAYAPRSWLHGAGSPIKQRFFRYANASSQERRA